jgi:hypothetical protein
MLVRAVTATGIIGRHVAITTWTNHAPIESAGEVVACDLREDDVFMLLVARDDGSLTTADELEETP